MSGFKPRNLQAHAEFVDLRMLYGLMTAPEYLRRFDNHWNWLQGVLGSDEAFRIAEFCVTFWEQHREAPGLQATRTEFIERWRNQIIDEAQAAAIDGVVCEVEAESNGGREPFNPEYFWDVTLQHFRRQDEIAFSDNHHKLIERGEFDKAKELVETHAKKPRGGARFQLASQIKQTSILWHWENVLPLGDVVLIGGFKELGKSQLIYRLLATATTGGTWPDGSQCKRPRHAIVFSAEDSKANVLVPRLEMAGCDMNRVHIPASLPETTAEIVAWTLEILDELPNKGYGAIIAVDPVSVFMGNSDTNKVTHVRSALRPLMELAHSRNVTVIILHHLRKSLEGNASDPILGSGGFVHCARVVHMVFPNVDGAAGSLFLAANNNLGKRHCGWGYTIVGETNPHGRNTAHIVWQKDPVNLSADQALTLLRKSKAQPKRTEAKAFLLENLKGGELPQKLIEERADAVGLSWATIRSAQKELHIKARKVGGRGQEQYWVWQLPTMN